MNKENSIKLTLKEERYKTEKGEMRNLKSPFIKITKDDSINLHTAQQNISQLNSPRLLP